MKSSITFSKSEIMNALIKILRSNGLDMKSEYVQSFEIYADGRANFELTGVLMPLTSKEAITQAENQVGDRKIELT